MATRSKAPLGEYIPVDDAERIAQMAAGKALASVPDFEEFEDQTDPDEIALENVLSELGSSGADAKVNVYQLDDKKNRAFVGSFLPGDFSIEQIQIQYGAGEYAVEVRKDKKWLKKTTVKIAAPRNPPPMLIPPPAPIETAKIMEAMQNGFKEMGGMFANALSGLVANQPKPKTSLEMLQEMAMMRDLMGVGSAPAPAIDPMQIFEMATNIAEKIQPRVGEPGAGEVILNAIKEFGPVLTQAAANAQNRPAPSVLVHNPAPPPAVNDTANNSAHSPQPAQEESDQMNIARKMYLNLLVSNAAADNDPTTYAQLMMDVAGEQQALEFASSPDWFERLCAEEPRAAQYRNWFDELRLIMLELTKPEDSPNTTDNAQNVPTVTPPTNVL